MRLSREFISIRLFHTASAVMVGGIQVNQCVRIHVEADIARKEIQNIHAKNLNSLKTFCDHREQIEHRFPCVEITGLPTTESFAPCKGFSKTTATHPIGHTAIHRRLNRI